MEIVHGSNKDNKDLSLKTKWYHQELRAFIHERYCDLSEKLSDTWK